MLNRKDGTMSNQLLQLDAEQIKDLRVAELGRQVKELTGNSFERRLASRLTGPPAADSFEENNTTKAGAYSRENRLDHDSKYALQVWSYAVGGYASSERRKRIP
jgi:hypothetical protein